MARSREFDFDEALEHAMQVFWAKGYEATSLDDRCVATGLGRSSLYAAFGDNQNRYGRGSAVPFDPFEAASAVDRRAPHSCR